MNEKNTKKLHKNYPLLFKKTPVGFECGDGWYELLNMLCGQISHHLSYNKNVEIEMLQVKEKFAGLRFYYGLTNQQDIKWWFSWAKKKKIRKAFENFSYQISGHVEMAESLSYIICENCGKIKNKDTNIKVRKDSGWWVTLCDECHHKDVSKHK